MKTILIIDDERYIRFIYKKIVAASCGSIFRVLEARNAMEAIEKIIEERVDLILLDIRLSNVDGPQLFRIIRDYNPQIKILIASVYDVKTQKRMIPSADGYYDKSEGILCLLEKIANMFADEKMTAGSC